MIDKKFFNSTDVFKGKKLPPFLKDNPYFTNVPLPIVKVFPSIGLSNFSEDTDIAKWSSDVKKEGSFVWNVLQEISLECSKLISFIENASQVIQFLAPLKERLANKSSLGDVAQIVSSLSIISQICNPRSVDAFHPTNGVVRFNNGKVELRLNKNILSSDGKVMYKAGQPIFRLYTQLCEKCIECGVSKNSVVQLDSFGSYKIFSKENIPNKKYKIVFSSDGEAGSWDIVTMSMRGTKSCQRWDGEYPRCLIGSVLSRFVGIMYLTSGAGADSHEVYGSLGTKMMRRCIVRYAYDSVNRSPCLIVDKMYPAEDTEIVKAFMDCLDEKINSFMKSKKGSNKKPIAIYYGPKLGTKTRHIYLHDEKDEKITYREKSYQDTALRTKREIDAQLISNNKAESEKYISNIRDNFSMMLAASFSDIQRGVGDPEDQGMKNIINNFCFSTTYSIVSDQLSKLFFDSVFVSKPIDHLASRLFFKEYLRLCFIQKKKIIYQIEKSVDATLKSYCSIDFDIYLVSSFLLKITTKFIKNELLRYKA